MHLDATTDDLHYIVEARFSFGRDARCNFHLDDPMVSRLHANLEVDAQNRTRIVDLTSRNGVFVNGERVVDEQYLQHLDVFTLGRSNFRFFEAAAYVDSNLGFSPP